MGGGEWAGVDVEDLVVGRAGRGGAGGEEKGGGVLGGIGGRVAKATASASVNLPTPRSMRGAIHTCSAGPLKCTKQPCPACGMIPQKDVGNLGSGGVSVRGHYRNICLQGSQKQVPYTPNHTHINT